MPSPSTPKRTATRRDGSTPPSNTKSIDVGIPLGIYDTNSVRDRIRQWQSKGGGVITASDAYGEDNEEVKIAGEDIEPHGKDVDNPSKSRVERNGEKGKARTRNRGRKVEDVEDRRARIRSGSAPAKRVVSDAHWRTKRSPLRSPTPSTAARPVSAKQTLPDDGIRVKPIPDAKPDARRKKHDAKRTAKRESAGDDDGIRVFSTPPKSRRQSANPRAPCANNDSSQSERNSEAEVTSSRSPLSRVADSARQPALEKLPPLGSSAASERTRRRKSSRTKEKVLDSEPHSAIYEEREGTRSQKGNILSQVFGESRKIFSKPQTLPAPVPRVPSIEAWLDETSDPFLDDVEPCIGNPAPSEPETKPQEEHVVETTPVEDPNKIWDSIGPKEGTRVALHGSKRRRRIRSSAIYEDNPFPADLVIASPLSGSPNGTVSAPKLVDVVHPSPECSPSSLKRRGAKRNPSSPGQERRKSISRTEFLAENDDTSTSSVLSSSSVKAPDPKFPLRPPGLNLRRPFPSTGQHRLSTIASVETFDTQAQGAPAPSISETSEATIHASALELDDHEGEGRDKFDPKSLERSNSRLAKHADLISVLSVPRDGSKSIVSARSIRTNRSRLATASIGDILKELATDEGKYMRELRTLVDGVIPVLLTCVLSKSDSAVAAGLFRPSASPKDDPNFTKPIVDMGIALERLKTLHKRIPVGNVSALLTWAQGAQRVYTEYLKAWRMGFQDVVVNLAPAAEGSSPNPKNSSTEPDGLDLGLPRNKDGDVVDGDGERVDVAFLLKRPLVRLKYLSKTLKGISFISPSPEAESLANKYQSLVIDARNRSNEERARLEDEAAANIDPTRARDPRTLVPLNGVTIDKTRHVRARDHFNLALPHSSGQCMDCRVELLLRDEASGAGTGGDLLLCEVDSTGRWLLFPPVQFGRVSARNGDLKGEIVVMIRGFGGNGKEWQELFYLRSDDEQTGFEWVQMLGLTPVPPKVMRSQSFVSRHSKKLTTKSASSALKLPVIPSSLGKSRTPSPREVDIPIGEQANPMSKPWIEPSFEKELPVTPIAAFTGDTVKSPQKLPSSPPTMPSKVLQNYVDEVNDLRSLPSQASSGRSESLDKAPTPRGLVEALDSLINTSPSALRRSKAKRLSKHADSSPVSPRSRPLSCSNGKTMTPSTATQGTEDLESVTSQNANDHWSLSPEPILDFNPSGRKPTIDQQQHSPRPSHHRSRSSVPSLELPTIPKIRKDSRPTTPIKEPDKEPDWLAPAERVLSPSAKDHKKRPSPLTTKAEDSSPPPTPSHSLPSPVQFKGSKVPILSAKTSLSTKRRSSSPLKHEYEPSSASESSSDSETSTVEHNEATSVSDSSEDDDFEVEDPAPLLPLGSVQPFSKPSPQGSLYSLPNGTLSPSQSASQAPYKTVPSQPTKASKTIATIFSWSDKGAWECLHPDECSIVVTPGLIEAYEMSASHSKTNPITSSTAVIDSDSFSDLSSAIITPDEFSNERPLVALELTPLVPLRRGTAIDISIRSPPTGNSQITSGNNVMFRSRCPEECEALYALINHSRINNPTYAALRNARGPYTSGTSFSSSIDRRASTRGSGSRTSSWFGSWGGSSGYRASSAPTPSIAPSESSIGSMASAFSALKRFGKGGGVFNIARSTISSRNGSGANSVYTSSDNSSGSGASSPIPPGGDASKVSPIGLSNAKIRLYIRETASRWRDMGSARLTIMRPSSPTLTPGGPSRVIEKRIVVNGKTKGEVLLDVQLGESCFERVARTGIALSVWEDVLGPNGEVGVVGAVGGVGGGRARVYMIQMKSEAETAYTFSIVGKLRY